MEVPRSVWPEAPWSPVGYRVVVTDETVPGAEAGPQPDRLPTGRETGQPPLRPWARAGYRVVEVEEDPGPGPARRPSRGAGAAKGSPPQTIRPLVRWGAVAGFGFFMLAATAAVAVASLRQPAWTRSASDHAAVENGQPGELRCAAGECRGAARGTCGTAVRFERSPAEAARIAAQEQKLTFLLHVSGNFDDPGLT